MERATRIELASSAWKAEVLPLNYTRSGPAKLAPIGINARTATQWATTAGGDWAAYAGPLTHDQPSHTTVCVTLVCMAQVDRLSVTMAPEIGTAVREAAAREGTSVSTWLTDAAAQRLRNDLLGAALDLWEAEDGPFRDDELNTAAAALSATRRRGAA